MSQTTTGAGAATQARPLESLRDLVALTKPRITLLVAITAAGGMWLAPGAVDPVSALTFLLGLVLTVGAANGLNCWLERDVDRLMRRTAKRPLPSKRLEPRPALVFSVVLAAVALPLLLWLVNPLTALLGAIALISYVAIYTPLKQLSPTALLVGAVPGALPPLMGWTAVTGRIDAPGLVLFGILFCWQLPHFIAIATFRKEDYAKAGLRVLPAVRGDAVARRHALLWAALLVPVSIALWPLGSTGWGYAIVAGVAGVAFLVVTAAGLASGAGDRWARRVFLASLVYLPLVFAALMIDAR